MRNVAPPGATFFCVQQRRSEFYCLFDCETEERALEIAADMPFADQEPVELWPVPHDSKADL